MSRRPTLPALTLLPLLVSAALFGGCKNAELIAGPYHNGGDEDCAGLSLRILEEAAEPPAHIAARVRIAGCDGRPIDAALTPADFTLAEDGVVVPELEARRTIGGATREVTQLTLLALDLSGSVKRAGLEPAMLDGARRLVRTLLPTHRIAIFGFDGRPDLVPYAYFSADEATLLAAIDRIARDSIVDDSTNLNGAVVNALNVLDSIVAIEARDEHQVVQGSLVLFTDGADRAGRVPRASAEAAAAASHHATFAIALGADVDRGALERLARSGQVYAAGQAAVLGAFDEIASEVRERAGQDYLISYCTPARTGAHQLEIRARSGGLSGSARIDFLADGFGGGCAPEDSPIR